MMLLFVQKAFLFIEIFANATIVLIQNVAYFLIYPCLLDLINGSIKHNMIYDMYMNIVSSLSFAFSPLPFNIPSPLISLHFCKTIFPTAVQCFGSGGKLKMIHPSPSPLFYNSLSSLFKHLHSIRSDDSLIIK